MPAGNSAFGIPPSHFRLVDPPHRTEDSCTMKMIRMFFTLTALLFLEAAPLTAQIPASEMPPPGTDTGLDGKYDPENGIAQLIRDKSAESAASKIFEDEHVLVFMPLPQEEVVAPGHVLVVPKRLGARNILDLKPDELRDLMVAVQKAGIAQRKGLGATGFRVSQNNGLSANQSVYHAHFHVVPFFGDGPPRSEEHTSELQSLAYLVCRLLLETKTQRTVR